MLTLEHTAVISDCGRYRYILTRQSGPGECAATFIMLNPSTADAVTDDPTIRRCIGFAGHWGCSRLVVLNLFAVRATEPRNMKQSDDPVGPENKSWFERALKAPHYGPVVCAWGIHGNHIEQDRIVLDWLESKGIQPQALGITRAGHPKHPLYLPSTAQPIPFARRP
jgi:hypothetical protein